MDVDNSRLAGDIWSIREECRKKAEKEKEKKARDDEITVTTTGIPRASVTSPATSPNRINVS